jgi:hypothetical protein
MFNIESNTLNTILIGVIIAILIILFFKVFNVGSKQENLYVKENETSAKHKFDDIRNPMPKCNGNDTDTASTETTETTSTNSDLTANAKKVIESEENLILPIEKEAKRNIFDAKQYCDLNEMEDMDHRLIRDVVVGRKYQQGDKQHEFSKDEVDNYFLQQQDFDDKVNFSSRNTCDPVAKLAQDRTHNTELVNKQGLTIGDVFDGLTRDQVQQYKKCKNPGCVIPAQYDDITQRQYYFDRNDSPGATYSNYTTRYETDGVNNGGKFYEDIEAHDQNLLNKLAYKM